MSSLKSPLLPGEVTGVTSPAYCKEGDIVKTGHLKKLKSVRKKFFVLRAETSEALARLEYYESEKKFLAHQPPKRSISLKTCFNINRRTDLKPKYVIALYTKDDCFCVAFDTEEECESWLRSLLTLQHGEEILEGRQPKPDYEHVWQVTVQNKGIGHQCNIVGKYRLCLSLSTRTVSLVKHNRDGTKDSKDFSLTNVRTCGAAQSYFYMEVGRQAVTGAGAIWMSATDDVIASDINRIMTSAMGNGSKDDGRSIVRSHSVSESSKPNSIPSRRQTHSGTPKSVNHIDDKPAGSRVPAHNDGTGSVSNIDLYCEMQHHPGGGLTIDQTAMSVSTTPAVGAIQQKGPAAAPVSAHHHQRTYSFPLSPLPPSTTVRRSSIGAKCGLRPVGVAHSGSGGGGEWVGGGGGGGGCAGCAFNIGTGNCGSSVGRDRCDSLPSSTPRPGVVNDNSHYQHGHHHNMSRNIHHSHPVHGPRPHSMYSRAFSHSPPVASSPASPSSGACSTDSAGSSLSIDEGDGYNWSDGCVGDGVPPGRYGIGPGHSLLTPEEPSILEENSDEYAHWGGPMIDSSEDDKMNNYVPMSPASLSLPLQSLNISSNVMSNSRKLSSGSSVSVSGGGVGVVIGTRTGSSPSHLSYMDVCSPCGSSPRDNSSSYAIMGGFYNRNVGSHQTHTAPSSANHSRTSSLAEETPDGYVPMMPGLIDDGYVDMEPAHSDSHEDFHHGEMSQSSQGSLASGTLSTDLRFSEYQTEKGDNSYLEEDTGVADRPTRCYSVGSKPESLRKKTRLDALNQMESRVRAFSVGSRNAPGPKFLATRPLAHDLHARHAPGGHFTPPSHHRVQQPSSSNKKSLSAPLLSNSWSGSPMNRQLLGGSHSSVEPMDDLMEMDFSHNATNKSRFKGLTKSRTKTVPACATTDSSHQAERERLYGHVHSHSADNSYVDMNPSRTGAVTSSTRTVADLRSSGDITTGTGSPPKHNSTTSFRNALSNAVGIVRSPPEFMARSPPGRTGSSPRSAVARMTSITELKPQSFPSTTPSPPIKPNLLNTTGSTSMAVKMKMGSANYMDMRPGDGVKASAPVTSSYVEMKPRHVTASSAPTRGMPSPSNQEYVDMNFVKPRKMSACELKDLNSSVRRTAPVDTPMVRKPPEGYVEMSWNQSKPGRKWSADGFRVMSRNKEDYMNMTCGSTKTRKERRSSRKDSGRSSTGSGSGSGGSPVDNPDAISSRSRKSSRDSTSSGGSSMTPTGSNSTIFPLSPGSPLKSFPPPTPATAPALAPAGRRSPPGNSYVDMTPGKGLTSPATSPSESADHDYVNFCPGPTPSDKAHSDDELPKKGDSVKSPTGEPVRKISAPVETTYSKLASYRRTNDLGVRGTPTLSLDGSTFKSSRPASEPLTISSLLGVNNLNTATTKPMSVSPSRSTVSSNTASLAIETKIVNKETAMTAPSITPAGSGAEDKTVREAVVSNIAPQETPAEKEPGMAPAKVSEAAPTTPPATAPLAITSPSWSPSSSPSPIPAEPGSGKGSPCKKMSSGSESSSTSRDSQQPSPAGKGKAKAKTKSETTPRRLSCPNKVNVSRQGSASSETSEVSSQSEEAARISGASKQTTTAPLDKRSFSCSPELLGSGGALEANPSPVTTTSTSTTATATATATTTVSASISPVATVEKELNYASLDLRSGSESEDSATKSPRLADAHSATTSPNPADGSGGPSATSGAFTYAEIDFVKSEEFRRNAAAVAASSAVSAVAIDASAKRRV